LGPPGSGKGTQAKLLAAKLGLPHISLGDMLRDEVRKESEIGKIAKELINAGRLAPNEITIDLTRQRIAQDDCRKGFILDGFPRSKPQAEGLDKMLAEMKTDLTKVIYFNLSEDEVVTRLCGRRSCKGCGAVFHVEFNPPKAEDKCDRCGKQLYQRKDDVEDSIRTRFEVYAEQTKPLIQRYEKAGKLVTIDAGGSIEEVFDRLLAEIGHGRN
jgi:adenylate kinase